MQLIFNDSNLHLRFAPLTLTRPVSELRFGIMTISETWIKLLSPKTIGYHTEKYLQKKFPTINSSASIVISGNIKPDNELAKWVKELKKNEALFVNETLVAINGQAKKNVLKTKKDLLSINHIWELFQKNGQAIESDFKILTHKRKSQAIPKFVATYNKKNIFIEKGAKIFSSILNADTGPIYIGKDAEVMEGSIIRGPFSLGEHSVTKMASKIYGPTTIGPFCKVGGEISNSIFQAYSNKGHDGFLGNSVIGEWCNFGADTNSSNLMNTYDCVKLFSYENNNLNKTDVTFCGVIMGDHSKTGINTMLNTATSVGVCSNIFGAGFPPKFIPSFTWGGFDSKSKFNLDKAYQVAENMMSRRDVKLTSIDKAILKHIHGMA